ncbi:MAG: hypothetical protein AB1846_05230 [Chloroflexota bacterium]
MSLITVFSAPKPFTDPHVATIQRNAIRSWTLLPDVEVILFGDEEGLASAAREFNVKHIPDVARNTHNTPLVSSMFDLAREHSHSLLLAIVNADIILLPDFVEAARKVSAQRKSFVLLGQRWDLDVTEPLDFSEGWQERLRNTLHATAHLHRPAGSDYFLFPLTTYHLLPAFAIGRAGWDNWMIYHARKSRFPAIDATHDVTIIHQNHDYRHLPGGQPHYDHPETDENVRLAGGRAVTRFTLLDADRRLVEGRIRPQPLTGERLLRRVIFFPLLAFGSTRLTDLFWRWSKPLRQKP